MLDISGIEDVRIINNNTGSDQYIVEDDFDLLNHNVYIILKYREGITIQDETIGKVIYNKMTPGVVTQTATDDLNGEMKSYDIVLGGGLLSTNTKWKRCIPMFPTITVKFSYTENYIKGSSAFSKHELSIVDSYLTYLNNKNINESIQMSSLRYLIQVSEANREGLNVICSDATVEESNVGFS